MAFITTGLTNGGLTTHYQIKYDDSLSQADGRDRANALIGVCEADFTLMTNWFGGIALPYTIPYEVQISPGPGWGASWGSGPPVNLVPGDGSSLDLVRFLLVAEVTEMFMLQQGLGWSPLSSSEGSAGEGLSHFLATQLLISIGSPLRPSSIGNIWLNSPRLDFVNNVDFVDHSNDPKSSCAVLFLYYLSTQLGFSVNSIVAAGAQELSGVYQNLTGDANDPFPFFKQLLDAAYPSHTTSAIPGPNFDDPFPVGSLSFWVDKSTYGKDEVNDVLSSSTNGAFQNAFWLVLEGFNRQVLGTTTPTLSGPAHSFTGITMPVNSAGTEFERPTDQLAPQRVRFPFDVKFSASSVAAFPATGAAPLQELLNGSITVLGTAFPTATVLEFTSGADPYFTSVDPSQNNENWLSQDLRVFTATPAANNTPVSGAPAFGADNFNGAYAYVQSLITYLNNNYSDPASTDPFNAASNVIPEQAGAYTGDSSVTPSTGANANYNFGIARVRLRGTSGVTGEAQNVKVFFRLWGTQTADTDYQVNSTYRSHLDASGLPDWPLPATDGHTIPFFATSNSPNFSDPNNTELGAGGVNNQTIVINSGDSRWAYFGCFLNVYDSSNVVNGSPVQSLLTGTHHCLVAQIAYDDAPIINSNGVTMSPGNSDKLAQRNLQVTHSDNPGAAATHLIPQTFDLRPSPAISPVPGSPLQYPDELMIDWGNTPQGSTASIYWPQVNASEVLQLASRLYASHRLSASDAHTIQCKVTRGVTYIPIPPGTGQNFATLLTIDLPSNVVRGQEFDIIVRRVATRRFRELQASKGELRSISSSQNLLPAESQASVDKGPNWRYIVGAFQVKIPVSTKEDILPAEENTLAIFKWRLLSMSPTNRWYPVLLRYISYLSARVEGLGGDPDAIPPSLQGATTTTRDDGSPQSRASACHKLRWLLPLIIAPLIVLIALAPTLWAAPLSAVGIVLIVAVAWYWRWLCKPSVCDLLCALILGIGVADLVLGIVVLLGYRTLWLLLVLAVLGVVGGILVLVSALRGCCGRCEKREIDED
jgi:hypothetical protein